jgi:hypothetical protein
MNYNTLTPENREIRLLRLKPKEYTPTHPDCLKQTHEAVPLYCDLLVHSLDTKPNYIALSYRWGEVQADPVHVNGVPFSVRKNLRDALEHLQDNQTDVVLWTDAICINQEDVVEKGSQVAMMGTIYAKATSTLVWLGEIDFESSIVMGVIRNIGQHVENVNGFELFDRLAKLYGTADWTVYLETERPVYDLVEPFFKLWLREEFPIEQFRKFLARDYWSRVWILQEFVVSPDLEIMCGTVKMPFDWFHGTMMFLPLLQIHVTTTLRRQMEETLDYDQLPYVTWMSESIDRNPAHLCGMRKRFQKNKGEPEQTLFQLLVEAHVNNFTHATNRADKVFALLGIASDAHTLGVKPDYQKSTNDVYRDVARAIIESGLVDLLSLCQFNLRRVEKSTKHIDGKDVEIWTVREAGNGLPSWVPDWRVPLQTPAGQLPGTTIFHASGKNSVYHCSVADVPDWLTLRGHVVDTIEVTKAPWQPSPHGCTTQPREVFKYLSDILALCQESEQKFKETGDEIYANPEEERQSACYRLPIADQEYFGMGYIRKATENWSAFGQGEVIQDIRRQIRAKGDTNVSATQEQDSYYTAMGRLKDRRPFISARGFIGLGPMELQAGDIVVIFMGAKLPYILRRYESSRYRLIGEAYVQGIMYGEFMVNVRTPEDFVLV